LEIPILKLMQLMFWENNSIKHS